ncbi:MAG: 3-dehydroquinate dehydratase [Rhodospirillaceae bacterium]|nr:3-dehydroquinate dehydratase [Rhodospirillaceae bacterium]MBT6139679.1 3-dehydroquinate dehydratase [Rhodospirillaceae bacterium]
MTVRLTILNGSNLNLLGEREPEIYGSTTLAAIEKSCSEFAEILGVELQFLQTNHEGVMVDWIQEMRHSSDALIINPAGYSFHSIPVLDALKIYPHPIIELHISNIHARDDLHKHSIQSGAVTSVICGLGAYGYIVAMQSAARMVGEIPDTLPAPISVGPV